MGKDVSDVIGTALGNAAREALQGVSKKTSKSSSNGSSPTWQKGVAAGAVGAGLMALAPAATKGVGKLVSGAEDGVSSVGDLKDAGVEKVKDASVGKLKEAGSSALKDATGKAKDEVVDSIPGSGLFGKGKKSGGAPGVPKGRRMPVQQDMDIGVPLSVVYNQWTQFEEWPKFMHRLKSASQEDESHVSFKVKIWGKTKDFKAEIVEQRPEERIEWKATEGPTHTGVITFHELGPRLTRIEVNVDFEPGSLIEKAGRGMRFVKRAVRADMARFKAYVLMQEEETGSWRGEIQDGEVKPKSSSSSKRSSSRSKSSSNGSGSSGSASGRGRSSSSARSSGSSNGRSRSASGGRSRAASGSGSSRRRSSSSS